MKATITAAAVSVLASTALAHPPSYKPKPPHHKPPPGYHHGPGYDEPSNTWNLKKFTSLVAFGDSYSDDSRLGYFINNGTPPVGYENPANYAASSGGRIWVQYVGQYASVNTYNYAVSGAVCSNDVTPRYFSAIDAPFPAVAQYEVPAYLADNAYYYPNGTKFQDTPVAETVYSIFIGTNDLGNDAFITDSQVPGTDLTDYVDCVYNQFDALYESGARYFVLQNVAPLQLLPQYASPEMGGLAATQYWQDKPSNISEVHGRMQEQVVTVNAIFDYRTPFAVALKKRYPGAHFAVMDIYGLLSDIYYNPAEYLNGTAPLNVTGYINQCEGTTGQNCTRNDSPDSFMWYDELHPSEQTDRIIARNFVDVVGGASKWATYWS